MGQSKEGTRKVMVVVVALVAAILMIVLHTLPHTTTSASSAATLWSATVTSARDMRRCMLAEFARHERVHGSEVRLKVEA